MKAFFILLIISFNHFVFSQTNSNYQWAIAPNKNLIQASNVISKAMTKDASGNIYITGRFAATADFDPGPATYTMTALGHDIFFAKYDSLGNFIWAKAISNGSSWTAANDIAVDSLNNVYLTGIIDALSVDFDPGPGVQYLSTTGYKDAFFAKYDAAGNYVFAKAIGSNYWHDGSNSIAVDKHQNIIITGYFRNWMDFDPHPIIVNGSNSGPCDNIFLAKYDSLGDYLWHKSCGGNGIDAGTDVITDNSGNIYFTGNFDDIGNFDLLTATANSTSKDIFLAKFTPSGSCSWVNAFGGVWADYGMSVTIDKAGKLLLTGTYWGTADFDAGPASAIFTATGGGVDPFFAKYDLAGNYIWAKSLSGVLNFETSNCISTDNSGNICITGVFDGALDVDPGPSATFLNSNGANDTYIAKYNSSGNFIWANSIGNISNDDVGTSVCFSNGGDVVALGDFWKKTDFDPSPAIINLDIGVNLDNVFLAKYSSANGSYIFAKDIGGIPGLSSETGNSIAVDALGNSYVVGNFGGNADFDPGLGVATLTSSGASDIFLTKYDALSNYVWAFNLGCFGSYQANASSVACDANNNVYISGYFTGTVDFDPGPGVTNVSTNLATNQYMYFFAKYNSAGQFMFINKIPVYTAVIKSDALGNSYVTGTYAGSVDFDPGPGTSILNSAGSSQDIFLAKYDNLGNYVWAQSMGGTLSETATDLWIEPSGNIVLTGSYQGSADFDPSAGTSTLTASFGSASIFIAKYNSSGNYIFAKGMGGVNVTAKSVAVVEDKKKNILITGNFDKTVDFNPGPAIDTLKATGTTLDMFLAKYDSLGNYVWAKSFTGNWFEDAKDLAVDSIGNPTIIGVFTSSVDLDPSNNQAVLTTTVGSDAFFAKYDKFGNFFYAAQISGNSGCLGSSISIHDEKTFITGSFTGNVDFDFGPATATLTGDQSLFVAKYDPCTLPTIPVIGSTFTSVCTSMSNTLSVVSGSLYSASAWKWYTGSCGNTFVASGNAITVSPTVTTTYYVRSEGGCPSTGNCSSITINVSNIDNVPPVALNNLLPVVSGSCNVPLLPAPTAIDNCSGVITGTTSTNFPITAVGSNFVVWTYNDGNGNTSTQTQTVIVIDAIAPVPVLNILPAFNGTCGISTITAPTAIDNCTGVITGTTSTIFPLTTLGTNIIIWTYNDGNGNTTVQAQIAFINNLDSTVAQSGITLTSNQAGATYQWIDCANSNSIIAGATSQSFTASQSGSYAVLLSSGNCTVSSACVAIILTGSNANSKISKTKVYPNPTSNVFNIEFDNANEKDILLTNTLGEVVFSDHLMLQTTTINIEHVKSGIYFLKIRSGNDLEVYKLIKN